MRVGLPSTCGCVGVGSPSGGAASARLRLEVGLRRRGFSWSCVPRGPRPGGWRACWSGVSGCGLHSGWTQGSAFLRPIGGSATFGALYRWHIHRRRGQACQCFSLLVDRATRREKGSAHPNAKGTQDSSFARLRSNASALVTGSRRKRRSLGASRTNADPCVPRDPQPECPTRRCCQPPGRGPFGDHTQRQPRQRTSKVTTPAAAHQHDETTCGSAPTTPRPPLIPTHAVRMLVRPVSELDHAPWEGETVEVPFTRLVVDD